MRAHPTSGETQREMKRETQRAVFANAIALTELGFVQHDPGRPWLFQLEMTQEIALHADLGGTQERPVQKDTGAEIRISGMEDEFREVEDDLLERLREKLRSEGISVRNEGDPDGQKPQRPEPGYSPEGPADRE